MAVDLVDLIYEAGALPTMWPAVLQTIADRAGSKGAVFVTQRQGDISWVASPRLEQDVADYFAAGWSLDDTASAVMAEHYPGFRSETDFLPAEQIAHLPVHREFWIPRGLIAGAASLMQGAKDDALICVLEGFATHDAAAAAVPWLDTLRAPLARALSLTAQLRATVDQATTAALELAGIGAAVVSGDGRLRAANDRFAARLGEVMACGRSRVRFADAALQAHFTAALAGVERGAGARSIAVPATADQAAVAIHLLPLKARARDVAGWDGILLLLAEPANASIPSADLLRLLFDLTPGEARVARLIASGKSVDETARGLKASASTVRAHLKAVFGKIGANRQADLVRLLGGLGAPTIG